jgi:hypothetical protein
VPLHDAGDRLATALTRARNRIPDADQEKSRQLNRLDPYRDAKRLNGNCLFALARVYSVAKAIAIARSFELGAPTFVKEEAFANVARVRPDLAVTGERLSALRPFYELTLERFPQPLPFDYHGAEDELRAAIQAVELLAHG